MRLLDLFCGAGGAAHGYTLAGFDVTGVDIMPQPEYPYRFVQGDALAYLREHGHKYDAIHASPPCQAYSQTRNLHNVNHPELLHDTRTLLNAVSAPYIIENVVGAPLVAPLRLCGTEFECVARDLDGTLLKLRRHRLFESNLFLYGAGSCCHGNPGRWATIIGSGGASTPEYRDKLRNRGYIPPLSVARELMGMPWASKPGLSQAVPPAYTFFLGGQLAA